MMLFMHHHHHAFLGMSRRMLVPIFFLGVFMFTMLSMLSMFTMLAMLVMFSMMLLLVLEKVFSMMMTMMMLALKGTSKVVQKTLGAHLTDKEDCYY